MLNKKFDDPQLRQRLFDLISAGNGLYESLKVIQVDPQTWRSYWKNNEDFRDEYEAALNASVEPVVKILRESALDGDVTAIREFMKHMAPPPRSEADRNTQKVDVHVQHAIDPATISDIRELEAMVQRRIAATPVYELEEATIIEEDDEQ